MISAPAQLPPVRETPPVSPLAPSASQSSLAEAVIEELPVKISNIQGNIIGGFNKDHQTLLFLRLRRDGDVQVHVRNFRRWLAIFAPFVATSEEVLAFNRLFKMIRSRRQAETRTVQATWINIAFSFEMLKFLSPEADQFTDEAFRQGMAARAVEILSDPADPAAEGNPNNWVFGGPGGEADVVITVASDDRHDLSATVEHIETSVYGGRTPNGQTVNSGVQIIYKQQGATLPQPLTGHEQFGWLDGVSQPGIRGRIEEKAGEFITPRQNPTDLNQGKPGQDLLWPGEFVFGYPGQDPNATAKEGITKQGPDSLRKAGPNGTPVGPEWAQDGSFLVIRRLRQDVPGFHAFLKGQGVDPELLGAKLVGRWQSGAPIMRATTKDNPKLGDDDCANLHFEFREESEPIPPQDPNSAFCSDTRFPQSEGDKPGAVCPFASHIRKTYPRDDTGTLDKHISEVTTQTHRLLRRGIPYGDPYIPPNDPDKTEDSGNRGLVFTAYQTSIVDNFEFVQHAWANNPDFKDKRQDGTLVSGHDLIIGQSNGPDGSRERRCPVFIDGKRKELVAPVDWVIPTGGGYYFAPSLTALKHLAAQ
jgi:Dyp-type peroxidase family